MTNIPDGIGAALLQLSKEERMVAYLACKAKGKVKGSDLRLADRVRGELLDSCDVDTTSGRVTWVAGAVNLRDEAELKFLVKALEKLVGDDGEGVDIDLAGAAASLQDKVDEKVSDLKRATEAAKQAGATKS